MSNNQLKRTPLFETHKKLGAKIVPFAGWEMPVQYAGVTVEHETVRKACGLFDVSHMGELTVTGDGAEEFLQYICSNNIVKLRDGRAQYNFLLNPEGGVVDDIIVYRRNSKDYFLCVNAANTDKDHSWIKRQLEALKFSSNVVLENVSSQWGQIAVQGPLAEKIVKALLPEQSLDKQLFRPFAFREVEMPCVNSSVMIARTGYTGEDGFEIFVAPKLASELWVELLKVGEQDGVKPIGLGARDTLRLEAALPLHGHELRDDIPALSSNYGWVIKPDKGKFLGSDAVNEQLEKGVELQLIGLKVLSPGVVREGTELFSSADGEKCGFVTSGTKTPTIGKASGKPIALAYVQKSFSNIGKQLVARVRSRELAVEVFSLPFYKVANN